MSEMVADANPEVTIRKEEKGNPEKTEKRRKEISLREKLLSLKPRELLRRRQLLLSVRAGEEVAERVKNDRSI